MGVPKFYRWLSERYPCLSEVVKEYQIPEFDNLYLDMNGIIHNCSHPNDDDVHFRISEEKIIADIFHYLEVLFRMIRPRKVFFMAIDGVAPRAKMNQQRGRRFRSAKEAEDKEKEALAKGEVLPTEQRFDSNCITPGTEFMARLQEQLKYFVSNKISTDPLWQRVRVILSGHQVPGEGEHKIMEFIRYQRSQPDYDVDTRHCLYGLDADLIMLGLCSHEPYFSLLREEVKFGGKKNEKRVTTPESICFHLLHLSLMREYLELEFQTLKSKLPFEFNIEHIIDDWVLMGFLVGNDFIPNLPHFHINKGALPLLYSAYIDVLPTLSGYINENGHLNLERFEKFMIRLAQIDYDHFNDIYADVKWLEERHGRKQLVPAQISDQPKSNKNTFKLPAGVRSSETLKFLAEKAAEIDDLLADADGTSSDDNAPASKIDSEIDESDRDPEDESSGNFEDDEEEDDEDEEDEEEDEEDETSDEEKQFQAEFKAHKRNYYMEKLEFSEVDSSVLLDQAEGYVRAIQWILHYYYNGVCSWSWFYPHHYAPYVSDIRNFSKLDLSFDLGHPFLPYEQLLGVLPAASKALLPEAYRSLMVSANSPIIEFYPANFQTDKNGKQQEWEAVVLIPFIDENRLIGAMKDCESRIAENERLRNRHGPMQIYVYTEQDLGQLEAPAHFSTIVHNHAQCQELSRDAFVVQQSKLIKGRHPKSTLDRYIPGFPSTRHLLFTGEMKKANVCVFHMGSLNESMILSLVGTPPVIDVQEIARQYCGQIIFVNWPHLLEAKVVSIANKEFKYSIGIDSLSNAATRPTDIQKNSMVPRDVDEWRSTEKEIRNRYANRWGINIGETHIIVHACPIIGRKYAYTQNGRVTLEKQWAPVPVPFVLQATVKDIDVKDVHDNQFLTLAEVFPTNSVCFMLGHPGYGLQGRVLSTDKNSRGKVRIEFDNIHEPDNEELRQRWMATSSTYFPGYVAAQRLGISPHLLSRITGTIFLNLTPEEVDAEAARAPKPRKVNVGLNLKFNKRNEEVPGWSRKVDAGWQYSMKTVTVLKKYMREFPEFFDYIDEYSNCDVYTDTDVFGDRGIERGQQLNEFVQTLDCFQADRQNWGASAVETVALAGLLKHTASSAMKLKPFVMQVRPHLLYKPDLCSGSSPPDPSANYHLLDRVINVRIGYSVPLGLRGTVIGIKNSQKMMDTVFEVLFDEEFTDALPIRGCPGEPRRVYHVPSWSLINLTHGNRQQAERERQGKPTAVVRPSASASSKQQPEQSSKYQANKSYKAAVEQPPRTRLQIKFSNDSFATDGGARPSEQQSKPTVQPKLLTRQKNDAVATKAVKPQTTETAARATTKSAPNPSSLPNPFMDIWNSLLQQHQAATASLTKAGDASSATAVKEDQQAQNKSNPIPQAPKFPSLQEAARNLPKITKPSAPPAMPPSAPPPTANSPASETSSLPKPSTGQSVPCVPAPVQTSLPSGPSLSVEQLFQLAGHAPVRPVPPPIPVFSTCAQLMDMTQRRGLGIPLYNYIDLQDGSAVAEVVIPHFGPLARCVGKDRPEASELVAAMALRHPIMMQPMQPVPTMVPLPFHGMPLMQPPAAVPPFHVARPLVPNSFVPLQVVRQSVHHQQQKMHHPPPAANVPRPTTAIPPPAPAITAAVAPPSSVEPVVAASTAVTDNDKTESKGSISAEAMSNVVSSGLETKKPVSPAGRTSKPPGSRLAIRFTKP